MKRFVELALFLAFSLLASCLPTGNNPDGGGACSASNCNGCCDSSGHCQGGVGASGNAACGSGGAACVACTGSQTCNALGVCAGAGAC